MSRLREGRANTARGAAHFLRETVGRVRHGGARGQLTVRADSGFYAHALVAVCREMGVRFSITIRQHARLRNIIEAIPRCKSASSLLMLIRLLRPACWAPAVPRCRRRWGW